MLGIFASSSFVAQKVKGFLIMGRGGDHLAGGIAKEAIVVLAMDDFRNGNGFAGA